MSEKYVVEVTEITRPLDAEALEQLATKFGSTPQKISKLIQVLPGLATKGISKDEATLVASYFNDVGMISLVKSEVLAYRREPETVSARASLSTARPESASRFDAALSKLRKTAEENPKPETQAKQPSFTPVPEDSKSSLPIFKAGRSSRKTTDSFHELGPYAPVTDAAPELKAGLRRRLVGVLSASVLIASLATFAISATFLWNGLKAQALELARLSTQSSAANLSRSIEENGDVSQFLDLPSPVPRQNNLMTRLVVTSTLDASPFALWPRDGIIDDELAQVIKVQAEQAVERNSSEQTELTKSPNPLLSGLIVSTQPLEHGSAIVGTVTTVFSYEPVLAHMQTLLLRMALFSLIPIVLALLLGAWAIRASTRQLYKLIQQADAISKGHLAEPVKSMGSAELKDLSSSLERLRVSTKTSLERLRERRDRGF